MDLNKLRTGEKIAGAAGIALLLIMFIFKWFGLEVSSSFGGFGGGGVSRNAWGSYGFIDIILFITVIAAVALAALAASSTEVNLPVALSAIVAGLGILSVILIIISLISPPNFSGVDLPNGVDKTRKIGAFLGLIAAAAVAYGGWVAMQEEGTSFTDQRDRLQGGGSGGSGNPPPPPPPAPPSNPPSA